jgi:hypothetical protein
MAIFDPEIASQFDKAIIRNENKEK